MPRKPRVPTRRPAATPEGRESQLVALAFDVVEQRLRDGTASAMETTHFLKLGSLRGQLEARRIESENLLLAAKVDQITSAKKMEELYGEAIAAMREYSGREPEYYDDDY